MAASAETQRSAQLLAICCCTVQCSPFPRHSILFLQQQVAWLSQSGIGAAHIWEYFAFETTLNMHFISFVIWILYSTLSVAGLLGRLLELMMLPQRRTLSLSLGTQNGCKQWKFIYRGRAIERLTEFCAALKDESHAKWHFWSHWSCQNAP